jgi:ribosomal protein S18 acetylase RimI-like enzyme
MTSQRLVVRRAVPADIAAIAGLHASRIDEGFLPTLGQPFLRRLYRRILRSRDTSAHVAVDDRGRIVGFAAACADVGALYRRFVVRDGVVAACVAAPHLLRSWRRALETLRYPAHSDGGKLPDAEILAVAVAPEASGRGVGRALVDACGRDMQRLGLAAVKVVAGAHNDGARALYTGCGFDEVTRVQVHEGTDSAVYVRETARLAVVGRG